MNRKWQSIGIVALVLVGGGAQAIKPTGELIAVIREAETASGVPQVFGYQSIIRGLGNSVKRTLAGGRIVVIRPPKGKSWQQHQADLLSSGMFDSVEPDTFVTPCATVNDPGLNTQYHLHDISAPRAWDFTLGGGKTVAVVDGGVDLTHPDLMANLVPGYNVLTSQTQLSGGVVSDVRSNGHGTRIAGVIAAVGNNGIGVSGVGPNLRVMPVRVTNDAANGVAQRQDILAGVDWAVQNGASVVNVSYSDVEFGDVEAKGLWARQQGAHLVWAAGNGNQNWSTFDHPNVTVVGGLNRDGARWTSGGSGSSFGRGVDIWAPCVQIYTTSKGGGYGNAPAGTSLSAPQVAAALALMEDRFPTETPQRIETLVLRRCMDLYGSPPDLRLIGLDNTWGWGRLNVGKAVENPVRQYRLEYLNPPSGYSEITPFDINDEGTVVGRVYSSDARGFVWQQGSLQVINPPATETRITLTKVNNAGSVLGQTQGPQGYRSYFLTPSGGSYTTTLATPLTKPKGYVNDISTFGGFAAVGFEYTTSASSALWWSSPTTPVSQFIGVGNEALSAVNDYGVAVGESNYTGVNFDRSHIVDLNTGQLSSTATSDNGNSIFNPGGPVYTLKTIANSGWIVGLTRDVSPNRVFRFRTAPGANSFTPFEFLTPSGGVSLPSGFGNNDGDVIGNYAYNGEIFSGIRTGPFRDMVTQPVASNISLVLTGCNNRGDLVGWTLVNSSNSGPGFIARIEDTPVAALSIGQLGATPTYIGSIPPVVSVTFTNSEGTPYPNATTQLTYQGSTGSVQIRLPASVTGPYRMYVRCNSNAIPGYFGPRFLNLLYPPLNEPAAPVDASYLPYTGTVVNGQPTILMYPGDVDESGEIDAADIDLVIAAFGSVDGDPNFSFLADVDGSLEIDAADIDVVISNFGLTDDPEP